MNAYEEKRQEDNFADGMKEDDRSRLYQVGGLTLDQLTDYDMEKFFSCEAIVRQGDNIVTIGKMTLEEGMILGILPGEREAYNGTDLELSERTKRLARGLPKTLIVLKEGNPHRRDIANKASYILTGQFPEY